MKENEQKIEEYNNNIAALTQEVQALEPEFEKNSKLFHSQKEVEDLYQNIKRLDWDAVLDVNGSLAVDATLHSEVFTHSKYISLKRS